MVDVRPFFGEEPEVLSAPTPEPVLHVRRGTFEQLRQRWIEDGFCPRPACHAKVDGGVCPGCGWTLADERPVEWMPQSDENYVPTLPLALTLDDLEAA